MCYGSSNCDEEIGDDEWFCSFCGQKRLFCPECSERFDDGDRKCSSCGTVRKAACEECGEIIDADLNECPECGSDPGKEKREHGEKRKKQAAGIGIGGPVLSGFALSGLHPILMWILWIPIAGASGLLGFLVYGNGRKHSKKAQKKYPSSFSKGESINKTEEFKEKKRKEKKKEEKKRHKERTERRATEVEMNCPACGNEWYFKNDRHNSKFKYSGLTTIGSKTRYGKIEVQCEECNHTRHIEIE
ncbi:hypothetical protein GKQ38_01535 [Candidatus Nanohaloarchaea archaeon]|nr:hypothetical protein GKQ38_01535 [Candidatus Nanohaloarchaea archaeon]